LSNCCGSSGCRSEGASPSRAPERAIRNSVCGEFGIWLQKAYDEHSDHVLAISRDPAYDPLRSDPRFVKMSRGIGLVP
jgi:hypothetical protein